ncbi:MAG: zinc metallopeptidase [Bacteroidetes bacterium]|nr:MAG: zinc metallopeptidase [Bacteroidota bacterium]
MFIIFIFFFGLSLLVSWRFKSKANKYAQISLTQDMSGAEIAEKMLRDNGIYDVRVITTEGQLTDHYNPLDKTVNLSRDNYYGRSITAAAVSAHECGHAVQHAMAYPYLKFRSAMVPVQNASAKVMNIIMLVMMFGGFFLAKTFPFELVIITLIICQGIITLFALVTLPVEFDASKRALAWLTNKGVVRADENGMAKDALNWAAMTYVVAALAAVATLLYYVMLLLGRRD